MAAHHTAVRAETADGNGNGAEDGLFLLMVIDWVTAHIPHLFVSQLTLTVNPTQSGVNRKGSLK